MFFNNRYITGLFLLALYVATATPLAELIKVPVLFEHYQEHRQESPDISVLDFFLIHYFNGNKRDADYSRDMQLPFKTIEAASAALAVVQYPADWAISDTPNPSPLRKQILPASLLSPPNPFVAIPAEPPEA
ncbi:MAG: hypothetical protein IPM98_10715 [Lewinellaceae bacterium]|nr:hypothetical protein [Lewinellaceae bacterium]